MLGKAGHEHNLDVDLLASLVKAESNGNARAVSRAGARGLMQLMPATAKDLGVIDSFKPEENVRGGAIYLDTLLTRYHDNLALALAAYNAGPEAVDRYHGIPAVSRDAGLCGAGDSRVQSARASARGRSEARGSSELKSGSMQFFTA
jgi:soluble lytic murein transglycosylase-like protein